MIFSSVVLLWVWNSAVTCTELNISCCLNERLRVFTYSIKVPGRIISIVSDNVFWIFLPGFKLSDALVKRL